MPGIFDKFRDLFLKKSEDEEEWPSVVMLLRKPLMLTDSVILEKAKKAWVSDSLQIIRRGNVCLLIEKSLAFSFLEAPQKYAMPRAELSAERRRAWDEHTAWMSVDFNAGKKTPKDDWAGFYTALMTLAGEFWDDNCTAMYFPAEGVTVPNLGSWKDSMIWSKNNGTNFAFLAKKKKS